MKAPRIEMPGLEWHCHLCGELTRTGYFVCVLLDAHASATMPRTYESWCDGCATLSPHEYPRESYPGVAR